jgi:hypothetical protein
MTDLRLLTQVELDEWYYRVNLDLANGPDATPLPGMTYEQWTAWLMKELCEVEAEIARRDSTEQDK